MAWRFRFLFLLFCLLVTSYWVVQQSTKGSLLSPLSSSFNSVYQPVLGWGHNIIDAAVSPFVSLSKWFFDRKKLIDTFHSHQSLMVDHVRLQMDHQQLKQKLDGLRQQLNVDTPSDIPFVTHAVIGMPTDHHFKTLVIAIHQNHKIKKGQVVVNAQGLVGRVSEVNWRTASVRLLTDPHSRIPVKTESGQTAIIIGRGSAPIELDFVNESTETGSKKAFLEGDTLYTSGVDEIFPPGIPVARVTISNDHYYAKSIINSPYQLKFVQVLINDEK